MSCCCRGEPRAVKTVTVDISESSTISTAIDLEHYSRIAILTPAEFDGTSIAFQGSQTLDGTYVTIHDEADAAISLTVAASQWCAPSADLMKEITAVRFLKLVTGIQGTTDTVITIMLSDN